MDRGAAVARRRGLRRTDDRLALSLWRVGGLHRPRRAGRRARWHPQPEPGREQLSDADALDEGDDRREAAVAPPCPERREDIWRADAGLDQQGVVEGKRGSVRLKLRCRLIKS